MNNQNNNTMNNHRYRNPNIGREQCRIRFASFIPKIAYYHVGGLGHHPDYVEKYEYFVMRQFDTYGDMTRDDMELLFACIQIVKDAQIAIANGHRVDRNDLDEAMARAGVPTR